jgi:signal transduction histidine kinase
MNVHQEQRNYQQTDRLPTWWRSPLLGYPFAVLFAAGAFLIPWFERSVGLQDYFIEPPFVIVTLLVAWIWGTGPALLALILEVFALDYWIIPPLAEIDFFRWPDIASFAPFILLQLIVLGLVIVQKRYRQQLFLAQQVAFKNAERLAEKNQTLAESNEQLTQANRVKDQFLAMASHELRTPVTSIHGQLQLLQRRISKQIEQNPALLSMYDSLGKVDKQARRLTDLVNDLLDLNSLRSGKMPVRLAPFDLRTLCQEVVEEHQTLTDRLIDLRLPTDPMVVQGDARRLAQVVHNLVSNALKYSPTNARVCVEVYQRPGEVILVVQNDGSVLSKAQQESIFEPFYRSSDVQSSAIPGWGLGLALSKEIVEQHHGHLWVESSKEQGTTFFVAVPLFTGSDSVSSPQ